MAESDGAEETRVLTRLIALSLIQGKTQVEAIGLLSRSGMDRNEIARVVGTNADVVSVRLAEAKRKSPKTKQGQARKPLRRKSR